MLNVEWVTCHAGGFDFFCPPVPPLQEENNFEIWGAWRGKIVRVKTLCSCTARIGMSHFPMSTSPCSDVPPINAERVNP